MAQSGFSYKPSMYSTDPQDTSQPINSMDEWARSTDRSGWVSGSNPQHLAQIEMIMQAVQAGQISPEGVDNLSKRVRGLEPFIRSALSSRQAAMQQQQALGQFFNPGSPATPDKSYTPQDVGSGVGPYQLGSPVMGTGTPAVPPKADYQGAMSYLNSRGMFDQAKSLAQQMKEIGLANNKEGPVLFDVDGNTYRATSNGGIVRIPVEGNARIAPPVYPYTGVDPTTGQLIQKVITKPQAAGMSANGPVNLGPSAPLKPLPEDAVTRMTTGLQTLQSVKDVIPALKDISGRFKGNLEAAKVWLGGGTPDAQKANAALTQFAAIAQGLQKGAASEPDIQRLSALLPQFGVPEGVNTLRANNLVNAYSAVLKAEISNYKATGHQIPPEIYNLAKSMDIDLNTIKPYSPGANNPYMSVARNIAKASLARDPEGKANTPAASAKPSFTDEEYAAKRKALLGR